MAEEEPKPATSDVDPELIALADSQGRDSVLKPILMIAVIVLGAWIISDWRAQLSYFFSSDDPVEIGDVTRLAPEPGDAGSNVDIPHNRYVSLEGIPTQRSQSTRYRYFRLIGAPVYVEQERDDYIEDPLERELADEKKGEIDRVYHQGSGRALKFSEMPQRYAGLRHYYRSRYHTAFCDELTEQEKEARRARLRDAIIEQFRAEYDETPPDVRDHKEMRRDPTDEQIERLLALDPVCVDAYLVQDGVEPTDHWWHVAAAGLFLAFMLFNLVLLVRWIVRFVRT